MIVIGRSDRIDLPELGYRSIKAKVDTGAYGNALHCSDIKVIKKNGKNVLTFILLDESHSKYRKKRQYFEVFTDKIVKNSSGEAEHRYMIETETLFCGESVHTSFTLTDRSTMKFPILLGRKFLENKYLVDVRLKNVSYKKKGLI